MSFRTNWSLVWHIEEWLTYFSRIQEGLAFHGYTIIKNRINGKTISILITGVFQKHLINYINYK